jgi:hypothetical protein
MRTNHSISKRSRTVFGPSRNDVFKMFQKRGRLKHSLWLCYSARQNRDFIFPGDAEMLHHYWIEGDPAVTSCVYQPDSRITGIQGDHHKTTYDALVRFKDRRPELREIKSVDYEGAAKNGLDSRSEEERLREEIQFQAQTKIAHEVGLTYVRISMDDLAAHEQLIFNWFRAIAFIASCRGVSLQSRINEVLMVLLAQRAATIGDVLTRLGGRQSAEYQAAIFLAAQRGFIATDMDATPLTYRTLLSLPGEPS